MALKYNNKTIIENCVETMKSFSSRVFVVTGYKGYIIEEILKDKYENVIILNNPLYENGMFSSVCEGIKHIEGDMFFITPGDYPKISKSTYEKLLEAAYNKEYELQTRKGEAPVIVPIYNGRKGHPILIDSTYKNEILNNKDYSSLRDFVKDKGVKLVEVDDKGILTDLDTIDDYNRILNNS